MFDERSREAGRLMLALDLCLTLLVFLCSHQIREFFFEEDPARFVSHAVLLPVILVFFGSCLVYFGAYRGFRTVSILSYAWIVIRAMAISLALFLAVLFLLHIQYVSRIIIVLFTVLNVLVLVGVRSAMVLWYFHRMAEARENHLKVLIIGAGGRAARLSRTLRQQSEWDVDIVGHLDTDPACVGSHVLNTPIIGTVDQISTILKNYVIDEVILAIPRSMMTDVEAIAHACEEEGVKFRLMADVFDLNVARMSLVQLDEIPLLTLEPVAQDDAQLLIKRLMDLGVSLLFLPILLPVMGAIAAAIRLNSPGPVFFVQERVGLKKRIFRMYKFRTMVDGSELLLKDMEHLNEAAGPIFKIADDPRTTRVGRFLRRTSLDELPQFFNILQGHMSLVGPRPMSLRDVGLFDQGIQRKRFAVKPGLTCLWQISGRSNLPFSKWLELDLAYIDNWSIGLDMKILLKTIPVVLKGTGAV